MTRQPAAEKRLTVAWPMPRLAPVRSMIRRVWLDRDTRVLNLGREKARPYFVARARSMRLRVAAGRSLEGEWDSGTGIAVLYEPPCDERGWPWRAKRQSGP